MPNFIEGSTYIQKDTPNFKKKTKQLTKYEFSFPSYGNTPVVRVFLKIYYYF